MLADLNIFIVVQKPELERRDATEGVGLHTAGVSAQFSERKNYVVVVLIYLRFKYSF